MPNEPASALLYAISRARSFGVGTPLVAESRDAAGLAVAACMLFGPANVYGVILAPATNSGAGLGSTPSNGELVLSTPAAASSGKSIVETSWLYCVAVSGIEVCAAWFIL